MSTDLSNAAFDADLYAVFKKSREAARAEKRTWDITATAVVNAYRANDRDLGGAYLSCVNLGGADLGGAILRDAYLRGVDLGGAIGIYSVYVPNLSERGDYLYGVDHGDKLMIKAGCFWDSTDAFIERVREKKGADHPYLAAADFLLKMWQHNKPKVQ